jgi:hypothetical protein
MAQLLPISDLVIGNLIVGGTDEIQQIITKMSFSLTSDAVSQITIDVEDPSFQRLRKGYFQLRMPVYYKGQEYEIAAIGTGKGAREAITLECRTAACQRMKRDKNSGGYSSMSPTQFAAIKAVEHGLEFFGEPSSAQKSITQASGEAADESTWDVLKRLAGDLQYWMFESDGRLFFTSQPFLVGRFRIQHALSEFLSGEGSPPIITYPTTYADPFIYLGIPEFRKSDDDFNAATMTAQFEHTNGKLLRPGMTIAINEVPFFSAHYLVTSVEWDEGTTNPVTIQAATPVKPKPRKVDEDE